MPVLDTKVRHLPVRHVHNDTNTIATCLLLLKHGTHDIDKVIDDLIGRFFAGIEATRTKVKH